jgi:hypothetical protein
MHPSIEFWLSEVHPESEYAKKVRALTDQALSGTGLVNTNVERIVVTDHARYAEAIDVLGGKTGFTRTANYTGVGKAIPVIHHGKFVGTNLLFHHAVIDSFLREPDVQFSLGSLEFMRYGFFHEFGHCVDFHRRMSQHSWKAPEKGDSHYRYCAAHNAPTLVGEYSACYFSSQFISDIGFREVIRSTVDTLSKQWEPLQAAHGRDDHEARHEGLNFFWRGLIEVAKIFALAHGNGALQIDAAFPLWPGNSPQTRSVLTSFAESAKTEWQNYPDCASNFDRLVSDTWFSLTSAEGFCYEPRTEGDCFYYRPNSRGGS